jgi:hypothetical protein
MNDILLTDNDMGIKDGDIATGNANAQDIDLLLTSHKGEWKQHPITGVGISDYLLSDGRDADELGAEIRQQLRLAGYTGIEINLAKAYINAQR